MGQPRVTSPVPAAAHAAPAPSRRPAPQPAPAGAYADTIASLNERVNVERTRASQIPPETFRLDRMRGMMTVLGNPERSTRFIHVAGSKGKGSTVEMAAAALAGCGLAVGIYTSPHLVDIRERIRVNRAVIEEGEFAGLIERVNHACAAVERKHGPATFFEVLTAAAFLHFAEQAVDAAVIEVGLGGRLDSTNVIAPQVCGLTAIQLEHTAILGDTLDKIAREKAGILKPGVPAFTVPQKPEVLEAFADVAAKVGTSVQVLGQGLEFSTRFEFSPDLGPHHEICLTTPRATFEHIPVPLRGDHQALNCGLVLAMLESLRGQGLELRDRDIADGLARTPDAGRLELLWNSPRIVADGAHTPDSIQALVRTIGATMKYDNLVVVFGCAADKDVSAMLAKLAGGADKIVFTKPHDNPRAMDPRDLQKKFAEVSGKMTQIAPTVKDAVNLAAKAAQRGDLICVTGSFYVAGEAKRLLLEKSATGSVQV